MLATRTEITTPAHDCKIRILKVPFWQKLNLYLFERLCATFFCRFEGWLEIIGRGLIFVILSVPFCPVRQGTCKSMREKKKLSVFCHEWQCHNYYHYFFMCTQSYNLESLHTVIWCFNTVSKLINHWDIIEKGCVVYWEIATGEFHLPFSFCAKLITQPRKSRNLHVSFYMSVFFSELRVFHTLQMQLYTRYFYHSVCALKKDSLKSYIWLTRSKF